MVAQWWARWTPDRAQFTGSSAGQVIVPLSMGINGYQWHNAGENLWWTSIFHPGGGRGGGAILLFSFILGTGITELWYMVMWASLAWVWLYLNLLECKQSSREGLTHSITPFQTDAVPVPDVHLKILQNRLREAPFSDRQEIIHEIEELYKVLISELVCTTSFNNTNSEVQNPSNDCPFRSSKRD